MQSGLMNVFQMLTMVVTPLIWLAAIGIALCFQKLTSRAWIAAGGALILFLNSLATSGLHLWIQQNPNSVQSVQIFFSLRTLVFYAGIGLFLAGFMLMLSDLRERIRQLEEMVAYREHGRTDFD